MSTIKNKNNKKINFCVYFLNLVQVYFLNLVQAGVFTPLKSIQISKQTASNLVIYRDKTHKIM